MMAREKEGGAWVKVGKGVWDRDIRNSVNNKNKVKELCFYRPETISKYRDLDVI